MSATVRRFGRAEHVLRFDEDGPTHEEKPARAEKPHTLTDQRRHSARRYWEKLSEETREDVMLAVYALGTADDPFRTDESGPDALTVLKKAHGQKWRRLMRGPWLHAIGPGGRRRVISLGTGIAAAALLVAHDAGDDASGGAAEPESTKKKLQRARRLLGMPGRPGRPKTGHSR